MLTRDLLSCTALPLTHSRLIQSFARAARTLSPKTSARAATLWLATCSRGSFVLRRSAAGRTERPPVDFNREIRPLLSNRCFFCHGPDEKERQADLRLDTKDGATADLGGHRAIVPGNLSASRLIEKITSTDPSERMPPPEKGKGLSADEVALLRRWVEEGAPFAEHWSYVAPQKSLVPVVAESSWPRNEIDQFVLSRLVQEGLSPSPEADRPALIRRVTLDLTGLPPTLAEVERLSKTQHPQAYEKLVDRLLAKEPYGEQWARLWLDLARYADSAGLCRRPARARSGRIATTSFGRSTPISRSISSRSSRLRATCCPNRRKSSSSRRRFIATR